MDIYPFKEPQHCKKCGEWELKLVGYQKATDDMKYRCTNCGYTESRMTAEAFDKKYPDVTAGLR